MSKKIIKLKESDLKKIVNNILESNEFDTKDMAETESIFPDSASDEPNIGDAKIQLGKDPKTGKIYVINNEIGDVMGVK